MPSVGPSVSANGNAGVAERRCANKIKSLREIVILLGPFKIATDAFSERTWTDWLVIPFYLDLINKCSLDPLVNPDARSIISCKTVAKALQKSLKARLNYVLNDSLYLTGKLFTEIRLNISFHLQTFEFFNYRIDIRPSHQDIVHQSWWSRRKSRSQSIVRRHFVPLSNNL